MSVLDKFLEYVQFDTKSDENATVTPSTPGQKIFGAFLVDEMRRIGIADAFMDQWGYVYGTIPGNQKSKHVVGFLAHMDTSPEISGKNVKPRVIENYNGGDISLSDTVVTAVQNFPNLTTHVGKTLVVTDGTTLLGGDDKAGVAEILQAAEELIAKNLPHGTLKIAFTPDEEIGSGADKFDVAGFGADYAFTVDGGGLGELEYENFNGSSATVLFTGRSVHPGSAKNKMINAMTLAMEFAAMLPKHEVPEHTEHYEGFSHLTNMQGDIEHAELHYIIRDHDAQLLEQKKSRFLQIAAYLNNQYGFTVVEVQLQDSYRNMKEMILPHMYIIESAVAAMEANGVTPKMIPIRGGTDGARLSFMGLPCPNLCTGGENAHGKHELVVVEEMEKTKDILLTLMQSGM